MAASQKTESPALRLYCSFFFNDTATTEIYTLSLHDALPIFQQGARGEQRVDRRGGFCPQPHQHAQPIRADRVLLLGRAPGRSEEHTSELQSRQYLVCRLLLEKKTSDLLIRQRLVAGLEDRRR